MKKIFHRLMVVGAYVLVWIKYNSPYGKAKLHIVYEKYSKTSMYRERLIVLGEEFAFNTFVDSPGERKLFYSKLTWKDKLNAFFIPYHYINKGMLNRWM